jgi:peptidoglycan/LPS O-acetylase OafA/YrhL
LRLVLQRPLARRRLLRYTKSYPGNILDIAHKVRYEEFSPDLPFCDGGHMDRDRTAGTDGDRVLKALLNAPATARGWNPPRALPPLSGRLVQLDGLRGIAVLGVMAYHFTLFSEILTAGPLSGFWRVVTGAGWIGVDLFFVLSGFLITGILVESKAKPHYFRNFYARRALRIFPLYYAALATFFVVLPALLGSFGALDEGRTGQIWYWGFLSNVLVALRGWDAGSDFLNHFWSLAIEEQFYLLWPFAVLSLRARALLRFSIAIIVVSLLFRAYVFAAGGGLAAYLLTPARMDGLAVGAALAVMMRDPVLYARLRRWLWPAGISMAALLLVVVIWRGGLNKHDVVMGTIGFTLLAGLFGVLLASAIVAQKGRSARLNRVLSSTPLGFFGKYSYGLYVFHQPIAVLLAAVGLSAALSRAGSPALLSLMIFGAIGMLLSVAASLGSWHFYEKHFLKLKDRFADSVPDERISWSVRMWTSPRFLKITPGTASAVQLKRVA